MPPRRQSTPERALILFGALALLWWFIPFGVKSLQRQVFAEFQAPSLFGLSYLRDLQDYWVARSRNRTELIELGMNLARLNAAYELRNQEFVQRELELQRLERLLGLQSFAGYRMEVARVAHRDINLWWQQMIVRKGSRHGVEVGQAVVFNGGVVGRVREVHHYTSVVELISNRSFRIAAHMDGDSRPIQFQGQPHEGLRQPQAIIANVPADIRPMVDGSPVRIVSSRLGGFFPDGLTLGWIDSLEPEPNGLFQAGRVRLDDRLLGLREVTILIPLEPNAQR